MSKSFAELCPVWNKAIKDKGMELFGGDKSYDKLDYQYNGCVINITSAAQCIVGEAYKWNSEYSSICNSEKKCLICGEFSVKFIHIENLEQLKELQNSFIDHWNEGHGN